MSIILASLRRLVIQRAGDRCEFCGSSQTRQAAIFYIGNITTPVIAGGATTTNNLALVWVLCWLCKALPDKWLKYRHPLYTTDTFAS